MSRRSTAPRSRCSPRGPASLHPQALLGHAALEFSARYFRAGATEQAAVLERIFDWQFRRLHMAIELYGASSRQTGKGHTPMGRTRPDEQFAFEVVGHLLGAEVEPDDLNGRQNVVDAVLHYPDGRDDAVLEVSSIGDEDEARIRAVPGKQQHRTIAGLTKVWYVLIPTDFAPKELESIDKLLLQREHQGIDRFPSEALIHDAQARTLWARKVTADVVPTITPASEPQAYVVARIVSGSTAQGSEQFVEELFDHLQDPKMLSKINKLAKPLDDGRPRDERHLFLIVRPTAFTFPVYDALAFAEPLPNRPPRLPDGVNQVWLASHTAAGGIVRAIAGAGWLRNPTWPALWRRHST